MDFESRVKELQNIASKMEDNNLKMADGVKLYEQGVALAKECYAELNEVKGKITVIKQDLDKFKEESLD